MVFARSRWIGKIAFVAVVGVVGVVAAAGCSPSGSGSCDDGAGFPGGEACPDAGPSGGDAGCARRCSGRTCGDDGCGGSCGACGAGETCSSDGTCARHGGSGASCTTDGDCDASGCSSGAQCVDWKDGKGSVCSCSCAWGTECATGCCWSVNSGTSFACRSASACAPTNSACAHHYECLNNGCGAAKSYCYGPTVSTASCGCGCTRNSDCASGCCAPYGNPTKFYACSAAGTPGC